MDRALNPLERGLQLKQSLIKAKSDAFCFFLLTWLQ
jgi:hypothetical protein